MKERFEFENNGYKYEIDNNARGTKKNNTLFEVKQCPNCHEYNGPDEERCSFCGTRIPKEETKLASWKTRWGLKITITSILWGIITSGLLGFRLMLGGLPTLLIYGLCLFVGGLIGGQKTKIDHQATEAYWNYRLMCIEQAEMQNSNEFRLTKRCKYCDCRTEEDSKYCSVCGKRL